MRELLLALSITTIILVSCKPSTTKSTKTAAPVATEMDNEARINEGKIIAKSTFDALSSRLKKAMAEGGVKNAVEYCNINAMPLTDSLSTAHNATIKRTTNKYRNTTNKPSKIEAEVISEYLEEKKKGNPLNPQIKTVNGESVFYAPIIAKGLCLTCHGPVESIPDYDIIKSLYPDDMAVNYNIGDLRGIWSITFKNK